MDNTDIFIFTLLVVPAFVVFIFLTVREFSRVGMEGHKPDADTRLK